jgi:hypothetical protein
LRQGSRLGQVHRRPTSLLGCRTSRPAFSSGGLAAIYGFLSQIFDYGNTDIEKRSIFFRLLLPLLTFGRER